MIWDSLERVWRSAGNKKDTKVRFSDWTYEIKYFSILGESSDGKRIIGMLDNGEKMSFSKKSKGWILYSPGNEYTAHAV